MTSKWSKSLKTPFGTSLIRFVAKFLQNKIKGMSNWKTLSTIAIKSFSNDDGAGKKNVT